MLKRARASTDNPAGESARLVADGAGPARPPARLGGAADIVRMSGIKTTTAQAPPLAERHTLSRARSFCRAHAAAGAAITLMSFCTYLPTIHQRGHYSDDFPLRLTVVTPPGSSAPPANQAELAATGWWAGCREYWSRRGWYRPLGLMAILGSHYWLWDTPVASQAILMSLHVICCLLLYLLALRLSGDRPASVMAAAILAAWPSYTPVVAWVTGGMHMLPAFCALALAMLLYLRYLAAPVGRGLYLASLAVFIYSILFHDQHLGAVAAFTVLAALCGRSGRRARALAETIPFWLAALAAGLASVIGSHGGTRPLELSLIGLLRATAVVVWSFIEQSVVAPLTDSVARAGPAESVSRMLESDPALLAVSLVLLTIAVGVTTMIWHRGPVGQPQPAALVRLGALGGVIFLTGLAIMALQDPPVLKPRHTLLPAMGLSMVLAAMLGGLRPSRWRPLGVVALVGLLLGLSGLRLGYTYEWTTGTRVTQQVLASLDRLYPTAQDGDLLVIDRVRKYGRGFADSWGLSGALRLRHGRAIKVTTFLRREGGRLLANAAWDETWEVDPGQARFFAWDERAWSLEPSSYDKVLTRHPELAAGLADAPGPVAESR